jgi:hypothetical protein
LFVALAATAIAGNAQELSSLAVRLCAAYRQGNTSGFALQKIQALTGS